MDLVTLEKVLQTPWYNGIVGIFGVLGVLLSIYFYYKSKKVKDPRYVIRSGNLISGPTQKIAPLEILFKNKPISNFSVSKVAFWNEGRDTIHKTDIAAADPLTITMLGKSEILDATVIYRSKDATQFDIEVSKDCRKLKIYFDYLDKCEGGVIQILHSGKSSDDLRMGGTIKGYGSINQRKATPKLLHLKIKVRKYILCHQTSKRLIGYFCFALPIICFFYLLYFKQKSLISSEVILLYICAILYFFTGYKCLKRRVPKGFEIFEEEFIDSNFIPSGLNKEAAATRSTTTTIR